VVNKVDIKDVNIGTIVTDDTDFGGASKAAWKGEIYLASHKHLNYLILIP
jgi:hypothetical protein